LATRATSLGYGKKVEWDGREDLVGPGEYKTIRLFDEDSRLESINKKKKKSFGAGREDFDKVISYNPRPASTLNVPGPGSYEDNPDLVKLQSKKYSMLKKTEYNDPLTQAARMENPGPGFYNDTDKLDARGTYFNSEFM
jgi:hypothetical protein